MIIACIITSLTVGSQSSVATALRVFFSNEAAATADFIDKFDKFFDLMNVTNYTKCYTSLKDFKRPYHWANDFRVQVTFNIITTRKSTYSTECFITYISGFKVYSYHG